MGYACAGKNEPEKDYSNVQGYDAVKYYETIEAQGAKIE